MRNSKKIDWLNHFLEFIVVVIGILLAFQLNTCSEKKKEKKLIIEHINNIIDETQLNKSLLQNSIKNSEKLIATLDSTIQLTEKDTLDVYKIHPLTLQLLSLDYIYIKKNAYNSLVQSGDIRFLEQSELQNDIVSLYEYYGWLEGLDNNSRITYNENYLPYATNNFDLINYKPQEKSIYKNKLFRNYLSVYKFSIVFRLQKQNEILGYMSDFLEKHSQKK